MSIRSKVLSSASPRSMVATPGMSFRRPWCCAGRRVRSAPLCADQIEPAIRRIAEGACRACGAEMELRYERRYPPTINAAPETEIAATAAASLVGETNVKRDVLASMGAEDFACFLEKKPGAYIWIGNGSAERGGMLHNPRYDFNDRCCHWTLAIGC